MKQAASYFSGLKLQTFGVRWHPRDSVLFDRFDADLRIFKFKITALDLIRASPPRNSLKKILIIVTFGGSTAALYSR